MKDLGFTNIDGLDPSQGLLDAAMAKKLYQKTFCCYVSPDEKTPVRFYYTNIFSYVWSKIFIIMQFVFRLKTIPMMFCFVVLVCSLEVLFPRYKIIKFLLSKRCSFLHSDLTCNFLKRQMQKAIKDIDYQIEVCRAEATHTHTRILKEKKNQ